MQLNSMIRRPCARVGRPLPYPVGTPRLGTTELCGRSGHHSRLGFCTQDREIRTETPAGRRRSSGSSNVSRLRREIGKKDTKQLIVSTKRRRQIDVTINKAFLHGWDKNNRNGNVVNPPGVTKSINPRG